MTATIRSRAIGWRGVLRDSVLRWGQHVGHHWQTHLLVTCICAGAAAALGVPA